MQDAEPQTMPTQSGRLTLLDFRMPCKVIEGENPCYLWRQPLGNKEKHIQKLAGARTLFGTMFGKSAGARTLFRTMFGSAGQLSRMSIILGFIYLTVKVVFNALFTRTDLIPGELGTNGNFSISHMHERIVPNFFA